MTIVTELAAINRSLNQEVLRIPNASGEALQQLTKRFGHLAEQSIRLQSVVSTSDAPEVDSIRIAARKHARTAKGAGDFSARLHAFDYRAAQARDSSAEAQEEVTQLAPKVAELESVAEDLADRLDAANRAATATFEETAATLSGDDLSRLERASENLADRNAPSKQELVRAVRLRSVDLKALTAELEPPRTAAPSVGSVAKNYCGGEGNLRDLARIVRADSLELPAIARAYAKARAISSDAGNVSATETESGVFDACLEGLRARHGD